MSGRVFGTAESTDPSNAVHVRESTPARLTSLQPIAAARNRIGRSKAALKTVAIPTLILVLACLVRVYWVSHHTSVLEGEECEYTRLAENLRATHTYVGMLEGPELMYPPLFPIVIAVSSFITRDFTAADRLVSVSAGVLLVLIVFQLVLHMYGRRVAIIAAALSACHPVLIFLSGKAYSESVDLPLILAGTYWGLKCVDDDRSSCALLCGMCFGLAYLTRPEALIYPIVIGAALVLRPRVGRIAKKGKAVLLIFVPFVALVVPYAAYLSLHVGSLRLEGKSAMNYVIGERVDAGVELMKAFYGLGPNLREDGPFLSPNQFVAQTRLSIPLSVAARYWLRTAWRNRKTIPEWLVVSPTFGATAMLALVMLGLFYRPWNRKRLAMEGVVIAVALIYLLILFGMPFVELRFLLPLLPFLIVWMSKGIDEISDWVVSSAEQVTPWHPRTLNRLGDGVRVVCTAVLILIATRAASAPPAFSERQQALKSAGIWLRDHRQGNQRIMSVPMEVAFYAEGTFEPLPATDEPTAREYLRAKAPDFLVLTHTEFARALYMEQWIKNGLPGMSLVHTVGRGEDEVLIYQDTTARQKKAGTL